MDMTGYLSDQRDALREALDATVRREAIVAEKLAAAREERDALRRYLAQVRAYVDDALLCSDEDVGAMRDYLYAALDLHPPKTETT